MITNTEALKSVVQFDGDDNLFEKALLDIGLSGYAAYSADNKATIGLAAIQVIDSLLSHPDYKDGKSEVKFDRPSMSALRAKLVGDYAADEKKTFKVSGKPQW